MACAAERGGDVPPALLDPTLTDEFRVTGMLTRISALAFAPNGHLIIMDVGERTVTVTDQTGAEVARWGGQGDGPGEFSHSLGNLAISHAGIVAIDNAGRVDLFTLAGEMVGTHPAPATVFDLAFDGAGTVLARTRRMHPALYATPVPQQIVRISDETVIWASDPLPSVGMVQVFPPHAILADLGNGRIAAGVSNHYALAVLDAATGNAVGQISRNVPIRGPSEEYIAEYRQSILGADGVPDAFARNLTFGETFPVIAGVFAGPPDGTIWVRRGGGVGDALAGTPGDRTQPLLYDLFTPDAYAYRGTVAMPDRTRLMAGDGTRIAGVEIDAMGVPSVRVMRVHLVR